MTFIWILASFLVGALVGQILAPKANGPCPYCHEKYEDMELY